MRLIFRQQLFSWFDSYDIYYLVGRKAFVVKGQLAWGIDSGSMTRQDGRSVLSGREC